MKGNKMFTGKSMKWIAVLIILLAAAGVFVGAAAADEVVASFTASPDHGEAPLTVSFDASASTGEGLTYSWDFGDESSGADGKTTSHTFNAANSYTVTLTVTDSEGNAKSTTRTITVEPAGKTPINAITVNLTKPAGGGESPETVNLGGEFADHLTSPASVTWNPTPVDGKFAYDTAYTATISVSVKTGSEETHELASSINVTANGSTSATYSSFTHSITVVYPKTSAAGKTPINAITVNLTKPAGGGESPETVNLGGEFADHLTSPASVTWNPTPVDGKFAYDTAYTATIPVSVKTGSEETHELASSINVTANGSTTATYANEVITVTYPKTAVAPESKEIKVEATPTSVAVNGTFTLTVSIPTETTSALTVTLEKDTSTGDVESLPSSVTIAANSKSATTTSIKAKTAGEFKVKAKATGYTDGTETVTITDAQITTLSLSVTPKPSEGSTSRIDMKTQDPNENNVNVGSVTWKDSTGNTVTAFEAATDYTAEFEITISSSKQAAYKFGSDVTVEKPDYATGNPTVTRVSDSKITVKIPFKTAELQKVTKLTVSGITAPVTDATPVTTKPTVTPDKTGAVGNVSAITWKSGSTSLSGNFKDGTTYTAEFTVTFSSGFRADSAVTIEKPTGAAIETHTVSEDKKTVTIEITYPQTSKEINSVALTMDAPAANAAPSTETSKVSKDSSAKYKVTSVSWTEKDKTATVSKFESGKQYTVTIGLEADTGYSFDTQITTSSVTVNKNSIDTKPTLAENNTKLTLKYTFPAITAAPTISLSASPSSPVIKLDQNSVTVTINHTISGDYYSASVNYGDGSNPYSFYKSSASSSSTHTYTREGSYTVTVNVYDENSKTLASKTTTITVSKEKVNASFTASPSSGEAPLDVIFTGTTAGNVTGWSWDFGDGTQGVGKSQMHTYTKPGKYTATLTVTVSGTTTNTTQTITVNEKPSGNKDKKTDSEDDGEPLLVIGDTPVPSFFDIIHEFVHLLQSLFDFENHPLFPETEEE